MVFKKLVRMSFPSSSLKLFTWSPQLTEIFVSQFLQICGTPRNGGDTSVTVVTSKNERLIDLLNFTEDVEQNLRFLVPRVAWHSGPAPLLSSGRVPGRLRRARCHPTRRPR
jgi:hypothetical protein